MRFVERMTDLPDGAWNKYTLDKVCTMNAYTSALICYLFASHKNCTVSMVHVTCKDGHDDKGHTDCIGEDLIDGDEFTDKFPCLNDWMRKYSKDCCHWYVALRHGGRFVRISGNRDDLIISVMSHFKCELNIEEFLEEIEQAACALLNRKEE